MSKTGNELDLLDEVSFGDSRGGRKARDCEIAVVRSLTTDDLPVLESGASQAGTGISLLSIRHSHHLLAQCLAKGMPQVEAALMTGYSASYISSIKGDPAFNELLAYYNQVAELAFVDVMERMRVLGLSAIDELQRRLEVETDEWTRRELMELAELMVLKGRSGPGGAAGAPGTGGASGLAGVVVNVSFVEKPQSHGNVIDQ